MTTSDRGTTDPLDAIGATLVAAARRRRTSRLRTLRGAAATAAALAVLALTGGALAMTGTSTGVLALDRWLDTTAERHPGMAPEGRLASPEPGPTPPVPNVAPADDTSPPVKVPMGDGIEWVGVGYEARNRTICSALVDPASADDPRGGTGCLGERLLRRALASEPARLGGAGGGQVRKRGRHATVYNGVARDDVTGLTLTEPGRPPVGAVLSEPWRPRGWNGRSLRVFFAVLPLRDAGPPRLPMPFPDMRARLRDGRAVPVRHP
jgi:hypothetical protein